MAKNATRRGNHIGLMLLVVGALIASSGQLARCQTSSVQPSATPPVTAPQQTPAYEVATIKPPGPNDYAVPLRIEIQDAFGIPPNSTGWVIGPDWINSARYVIHGQPPDSIRVAMQTMSPAQRAREVHLMMQGLLADRFKLKAHFETRVMPVYQLTVAKGGSKLKDNPDRSKGRAAVGASKIRGNAAPMHALCDMLESVPDIGGRVVVDKTGLAGTYDFNLKWTPMEPTAPASGLSRTAPSPDAEGASLFTAIVEQLGLKLVPTKGPGQVLVIDHIERPSEN
ncbi:MAG TPA: TIGR03435 family protein [Edaphobacter sp.]|nr:TIGR03435 family protein [Edaphobacter sp.]